MIPESVETHPPANGPVCFRCDKPLMTSDAGLLFPAGRIRRSGGDSRTTLTLYPPSIMPGPLTSCDATGMFASRPFLPQTEESAALRPPFADTHPDHVRLARFRPFHPSSCLRQTESHPCPATSMISR